MKKLILLLLLPLFSMAQTSLKDADIYAAAGNRYEWLLTNIDPLDNMGTEQSLIQKMGFVFAENKDVYKDDYTKFVFEKSILSGNEKPSYLNVHYYTKKVEGKDIQYKVEIDGPTEYVIKFYINFWTRAINFRDTKPGETVTTRFLTDVAALTVGTNGKSKIVVQTAEDYYKD